MPEALKYYLQGVPTFTPSWNKQSKLHPPGTNAAFLAMMVGFPRMLSWRTELICHDRVSPVAHWGRLSASDV